MKISSASKKVLASALSAAMVVAFAPTVAFGAAGDAITVTVDLAGGTGAQTDYSWAKQGDTISLGSPTKDGYSLDHWYLDANGDGTQNEGETSIDAGRVTLPTDSATATYRAVYAVPGFDKDGIKYDASAAKLTVTVENANKAAKGHDYTVTVKNPAGTVVGKKVFKAATEGEKAATIADGAIEVVFQANPASDANTEDTQLVANLRDLVSGEYTAEVSDGTAVVSTAKTKLLQLTKVDNTKKPAGTSTELIRADAAGTATATGLTGNWLDADGYATGSSYSFTADSTITKTNGEQYTAGGTYSARVVSFTVSDSDSAAGDAYAVSVTSPSGKSVYSAALTAAGKTFSKELKFTFDQADTDVQKADGGATEEAGTYVIAVTKTDKLTGETSSSKAKAVLTEVAYDAGEGSFAKETTAAEKDYFVDGSTTTVTLYTANAVEAPEGKVFSKWSLNGKEYDASASNVKLKAGQVNTVSAVYKAEAAKVAKPTLTSATKDLKKDSKTDYEYNVVLASATPGAAIYYTQGTSADDPTAASTAFSSKITVSADDAAKAGYKIKAKAFYVEGSVDPTLEGHNSDVVTIASLVDDQAAWKSFKQGAASKLEDLVGKSTDTKWLAVDAVKAAVDAGQAAIDAEGYFTADEKSATKVYVAQYKAVYEAVLATAKAELANYADEAPVASGTKAYYMTGDNYKQLAKAIDDVAKAVSVAEANDKGVGYADAVDGLITGVDNQSLYTESKDYTAADVKAASDVTASLKAATDATAAKAAIEAYNALTDAQKKLVATADVTAAQKIVADQEKIDEQDQAAVNYCNSLKKKTVKVAKKTKKTSKKASVSWKKQVSESGNAVTYAKVSGSAKITVSSNGVATLKKGVKKGTYKVKIAASCGNATRNLVTAKFIVK